MLLAALVLIPVLCGTAEFLVRDVRLGRLILITAAVSHAALAASAWILSPPGIFGGWLALDSLGLLFLSITSLLFLAASFYGLNYLKHAPVSGKTEDEEGEFFFLNAPEARFNGCLLLFLAAMTLVILSQHLGILWVAVEMTTLASAPLIYYHRHTRSLEATWKYLLLCSVGIAVALLGNFFLSVAATIETRKPVSFILIDLMSEAVYLDVMWLKAAFVCFLVGYGAKMGLAPMHTWLPDAHSESPSMVSALLSGALLNCAFLALLRAHQICVAAGQSVFSRGLLAGFGIFSMVIAAIFILGQKDYKRLLAYSSVEHMGLLAFGVGVGGGVSVFGALFHAVNHSLTKAALFLASGNILRAYQSKICGHVKGLSSRMPATGFLWAAGLFAITGMPPFGTFMSKLMILTGALAAGKYLMFGICLTVLTAVFWGMARAMLTMVQGDWIEIGPGCVRDREPVLSFLPGFLLLLIVLGLGMMMPDWLDQVLREASLSLGALP